MKKEFPWPALVWPNGSLIFRTISNYRSYCERRLGTWVDEEARQLVSYLLDELRARRAMALPGTERTIQIGGAVSAWPQWAYGQGSPGKRRYVAEWGSDQSAIVKHFLCRMLADTGLSDKEKQRRSVKLMKAVWKAVRDVRHRRQSDASQILLQNRNRRDVPTQF